MTHDSTTLLEAVKEVATLAGRTALAYFGKTIGVERKADGSPVTAADRAAEEVARGWIGRRFPNDDITGEEFGDTTTGGERRWFIDPIDGTKSFIHGVPLWSTLVAVCEGDTVLAGAAAFPAVDEIIVAAIGAGAWWNDKRCAVSGITTLSESLVLTTDSRFDAWPERRPQWDRLADEALLSRTWGDAYGYMLVATGRAEAMVDPKLSPWDAAALVPVITEAGGIFTDWSGRVTAFGGTAIATNRGIADDARALLGAERAQT